MKPITTPELSLEQLNRDFEKMRREWQSSKDRSVKDTNARLDNMQSTIDGLRLELSELRELLKEYLTEEISYARQ